jgi:hypothetical protein
MNNPFPRAASGSYKSILIAGLRKIGEDKIADEFQSGAMKLAIANSIYGNVKQFPELHSVCEKALNAINPTDDVRYYFWGIANGQFVVASSNVDFIYDPTDKVAVDYNNARIEQDQTEIIHPYFQS